MNTFQLFKRSFVSVSDLNQAKKMSFWKVIMYMIFLSAILALPITKQVFTILQDIQSDGQKIAKKMPNFTIQDGSLKTKAKDSGFIYQTNSIIFTFDPDGKRDSTDIQNDLIGNTIGVAFLQDEFVVALPNSGVTESVLGTNQLTVPYKSGQLDGINAKTIKESLNTASVPLWAKILIFFVAMYPVLINLVVDLLIAALVAVIYTRIRFYRLRFFDCLKIITYCATIPVITSSILYFINSSIDTSYLVILLSLFFFFNATKKEERYPPNMDI
jgi:maltodextrin utilization protein YvdJ